MEIIIFQLLSCLYLYDSGIPMPVRIRNKSGISVSGGGVDNRAAGIPASGVQRVKVNRHILL